MSKEILDELMRTANYTMACSINQRISKKTMNIYDREDFNIDSYIITLIKIPTRGKLYIGNLRSMERSIYKDFNIEYIVSIYNLEDSLVKTDIEHDIYRILDNPDNDTTKSMDSVLNIVGPKIHNYLSMGKNVLVHCFAGISRSATVVIDYIVKYHIKCPNIDKVNSCVKICCHCVEKGIIYVESQRDIICPNVGFINLLLNRHLL